MSVADWIRQFRALHGEAKKGTLSQEDMESYRGACDEFARALMGAQKAALKPGEVPRHALRVARALQVELEGALIQARVTTVDLGVGGFSAIMAKAPRPGEELQCKLKLPGDEPIELEAIVADVKPQPGSVRVSFTFRRLPDAARGKIEMIVIDTALAAIAV